MAFTESEAYNQLKSVFKGDLILPADDKYQESLKRWSILAERLAAVVAFVRDEADVSAAVKFAVDAKLEIAIRGTSPYIFGYKQANPNRRRTQPIRCLLNQRRTSHRFIQVSQQSHRRSGSQDRSCKRRCIMAGR